jgi:hypothetical protein
MNWKKWLIISAIGLGLAYHFRPQQTKDAIKTVADKSYRAGVAAGEQLSR